jgi:hypothetical protein
MWIGGRVYGGGNEYWKYKHAFSCVDDDIGSIVDPGTDYFGHNPRDQKKDELESNVDGRRPVYRFRTDT